MRFQKRARLYREGNDRLFWDLSLLEGPQRWGVSKADTEEVPIVANFACIDSAAMLRHASRASAYTSLRWEGDETVAMAATVDKVRPLHPDHKTFSCLSIEA